jgi:urease accessory protein
MNVPSLEAMPKNSGNLVFVKSGGDNLAASFTPELVDASIYVIDVAVETRCRARAVPASPAQSS